MWHEARKMEKKLWTIMVDHKKRAERRREYYEKIKLDPNQFLQVHGRRCKIHLDPAIAAAAEAPATMMPWQGQKDNLIDRFDGRAHLDIIPEVVPVSEEKFNPEEAKEHRNANYERYRILVQNDFLKISEEKFLRTIQLEEQFGGKTYQQVKSKEDKKKSEKSKAAIGFIYEDSTEYHAPVHDIGGDDENGSSCDSDSDSEMDLDLAVDIMALTEESRQEINTVGKTYSLGKQDFIKYLARDIEEAQELRLAKENEEGKNVTSGRKGRRERRLLREQKLKGRKISPPSYATRESPTYSDYNRSRSSSRSPSPVNAGKIEFITSFGAESDDDDKRISDLVGPTVGASINLKKLRTNEREEDVLGRRTSAVHGPSFGDPSSDAKKSRFRSRSRSASRSTRHNRSRSRQRDRNRTRSRSRGRRNRDRSRSRSPVRRYRSKSRSRGRNNRSRSNSKGGVRHRSRSRSYGARNRSRSRSYGAKSRARDARPSKQTSSRRDRSRTRSSSESKTKRRSLSRENPSSKRKSGKSSSSSSSSSSSDENDANDSTKYRSKYRNRRRSTSSSSENDKSSSNRSGESDDEGPPSHLPPKPIRRYYGRAGVKKSDSEISDLETEEAARETAKKVTPKVVTKQNLGTPQVDQVKEKIRRKMQAQIRKQFKADKKAEEEKRQREEENRITREEELREIAIKMRRRERRDSRSSSSSSPTRRSPERNGSSRKSGRRSSRSPRDRSRVEKYSSRRSRSRSRSKSRDRSSSSPIRHGKLVAY